MTNKNHLSLLLIFFFFSLQSTFAQCGIVGDSVVCEGDAFAYTTTASGDVYQWNAYPGTVTGSGASVSVNWSGTGTATLTLVVKDVYGSVICKDSKTVEISETPTPFITPSFIASCDNDSTKENSGRKRHDCMSVCDSTWVTYTVIDHPGSTYSWSVSGTAVTIPSTTNTFQVYSTGVGAGTVEVTETNAAGCTGAAELCVGIVERPNADFTTLPAPVSGVTTVCLDQDVIFQNLSDDGGGSDLWSYTYVWGDGDITVLDAAGSSGNTTHSYGSSGTYTVLFIVENECHCKDTAELTIVVESDPAPNIECISTVCPGSTITYNTDASCTGYTWSATNGTITSGGTTASVTVTWDGTGPGYLGLTTSGCTPPTCPAEYIVEIPVIEPVGNVMGENNVCLYDCETYSVSCNIPVDSIIWHLPPGVTLTSGDTVNVHEIEVCFYDPDFDTGTIYAEYYHFTPGSLDGLDCGGMASMFVSQSPKMNLSGPSQLCFGDDLSIWVNNYGSSDPLFITITDGVAIDTTFEALFTTSYTLPWIWGPGNFNITVADTNDFFCDGPQSFALEVIDVPEPLELIGPDSICPTYAYDYFGVASSSEYGIAWLVNNTSGTTPLGSGNTMPIVWPAGPAYPHELCIYQIDPVSNCKSETLCDSIFSKVPIPTPDIVGFDTVCSNGDQNYYTTSNGESFNWSVSPAIAGSVISGNGNNAVVIQWNNWTGTATISLTAYGCNGDSAVNTYDVEVIGTPSPTLSVPSTICEGAAVTMSSSTTGATLSWDFGDGYTGSGSPVTHVYNSPGNKIVTLTATYSGFCTASASATTNIMVYPKPNVSISTPDPNIFCGPPSTVNMYVASPVGTTSYVWYQSPSIFQGTGTSYSDNVIGNYYVLATNIYGCTGTSNIIPIDTACDTCRIPQGTYVGYTRTRIGCNKDSFSGYASTNAFNPTYDFDDPFGSPSTASGFNVSHTFPEPGYYRVKICVQVPNSTNTDTCTLCNYRVDTIKYIPDFFDSIYCVNGLDSMKVKMVNNTKILAGCPTPLYEWSINAGGTISTLANPTFTLAPGSYNITLTVNGVCEITKTIVINGFPVAGFTFADSICVNTPLAITNTSTGLDTNNLLWTFGDGASSTIFEPTKVYINDGTYTIQLTIGNEYGCTDSLAQTVTVLPNTLNALFTFPYSSTCSGDSILLTDASTGGYPPYTYLWSTLQTTPDIQVKYTGTYYFDLFDDKGCKDQSNQESFLFNPTPNPIINGPDIVCFTQTNATYYLNYPNAGYDFEWKKNGTIITWATNNSYYLSDGPGSYELTVTVTSDSGCIGYDTINVLVTPLPNVGITAAGSLCEGEEHLLIGTSTSPIIMAQYWSTGAVNDSIYASIPAQYTFTVVDTFGCTNEAARTIHPLPDFCGLMIGCYEICDTVSELVWDAPKGYAAYQWLYNGVPISGATSDTLHVPLYQSGEYQLVLTSAYGCTDTSEIIDLEFVPCGDCEFKVEPKIECGPVDSDGNQTYTMSLWITNSWGAGAYVNLNSPNGTFSGVSPSIIPLGTTLVTATFTDDGAIDDTICFDVYLTVMNERCKETYCIPLPPCDGDCQMKYTHQKIDCMGYDSAGNPLYILCFDVNWGGSSGSTLTLTTGTGSFSPNPLTLNNGLNSYCVTYTDLPPYTGVTQFVLNAFDPVTNKVCKDSFKLQHKPCDGCEFEVFGICAHCHKETPSGWAYNIELTVNNTLGSGATVSILPGGGGTFGLVTPNPIPSGYQTLNIPFTDVLPRDTILCFTIQLELGGKKCWQDVCVYLPDCETSNMGEVQTYFQIAPNPSNGLITVRHSYSAHSKTDLYITDATGKLVDIIPLGHPETSQQLDLSHYPVGVYFANLKNDGKSRGSIKLVIGR